MTYALLKAELIQSFPEINIVEVERAYLFAKDAHEGQLRYSGEPYIMHPVAAARILLNLNPDLASIQACLMHDVTEDTDRTFEDIEAAFSTEVARLVQGCEKLAVVKLKKDQLSEKWKELFLAMSKDIRIIFIKLADRLHNMRTLEHVPIEKQYRIAQESLTVHAAIASRLGIYQIKSELEDLCFQYLYPEEFEQISEKMQAYREKSKAYMEFAMSQLEQLLFSEGVKVERVSGRLKHMWSIYQKMKEKNTDELNDIYDLFAVRVVLPDHDDDDKENVTHLYEVLALLHAEYEAVQDRFKDYVAVPKPNGYRSLHTTIAGLGGELYENLTEVQVRTLSMHKESEIGVASHSAYKIQSGINPHVDHARHLALHAALGKIQSVVAEFPELQDEVEEWVERYQQLRPEKRSHVERILKDRGLDESDLLAVRRGRSQEQFTLGLSVEQKLAWVRGLSDGEETAELDLYPNKIFVLTPARDVIELPAGATPIDFAYAVHTEVGHKMAHAKANGRIVPLDYELQNGELVEVGTRNHAKPSRYWISLAKTHSARTKIKNWFNRQDREVNVMHGREIVNRELQSLEKPLLDDKLSVLKNYAGKARTLAEREQLLENIGLGSVTVGQILRTLYPGERTQLRKKKTQFQVQNFTNRVLVTGEEELPVILSACCKPRPPVAITGYVTRGRSIRVHKKSCRELGGLDQERFVSVDWLKNTSDAQ